MSSYQGTSLPDLHTLFTSQEKELEALYFSFLHYPSISADPIFRPEVRACADWVRAFLENAGFSVEMWGEDAPVVFASYMEAGPHQPTLLIYNHYDVQPVDPLELWESQPFSPRRSGQLIYARGAQDNKGQCFYVISALAALLKRTGRLPVNVKLCIEGEEESGSGILARLLAEKKEALRADYLLVVDLGMKCATAPAITLGCRGLTALTCEISSTYTDLHSGVHGGVVYNPLRAIAEILASLYDETGRVRVPGFYDGMILPSHEELAPIDFAFDEKEFLEQFGAAPTGGEKGFSPLERAWLRPTIEINGIYGGYSGPGLKTVIPARATAKLSCRLVPGQDPEKVAVLVKNYIETMAPPGTRVECTILDSHGRAVRTRPTSKIVSALAHACEEVYGTPCEYIYEGASIPIVADLQEASSSEVALFGLGLPTDCIHAPNEHFGWDRIEKGFSIIIRTLERLASPATP